MTLPATLANSMSRRLALVYGETIILDTEVNIELSLRLAKLTFTPKRLNAWLEHPARRVVSKTESSPPSGSAGRRRQTLDWQDACHRDDRAADVLHQMRLVLPRRATQLARR